MEGCALFCLPQSSLRNLNIGTVSNEMSRPPVKVGSCKCGDNFLRGCAAIILQISEATLHYVSLGQMQLVTAEFSKMSDANLRNEFQDYKELLQAYNENAANSASSRPRQGGR